MASNTILPFSIDDYFQSLPIGSVNKAITNNLYGINHQQVPGMVASNKDTYGLTFFVRPQLNLQSENLRNNRILSSLLNTTPMSIQMYTKCMLDPRLMAGYKPSHNITGGVPPINCPLVDNEQAFIAVLTNNLNSISGWPDIVLPTFTSKTGVYNEQYSQVDGVTKYYESFDLDANFRNTRGDVILSLFYTWAHYMSLAFEGKVLPYLDYIAENMIDSNTRVYRLVLDQHKEVVKKIAATGIAFPLTVPTGGFFDFNNDKPYNDQNKDISIRFRCLGVDYLDDILIKEFNATVVIFNPQMADGLRETSMIKINKNIKSLFNNRGYARIDPNTYRLEWWVTKTQFENRTNSIINNTLIPSDYINKTNLI